MDPMPEFYPTDDAIRRYRAAALRKTGRRISPDEARTHLLRWRRLVWEHRPDADFDDCGAALR